MFTPSTVVRLLQNVDITIEYKNTFSFSNATSQSSFFIGKTKQTHNDFTYVRKSNTVKVPTNIETLWNVSYMMFQNSNFGTKWFYAFITDMKYINDGVTEISFEIDVLQTWYFEMNIKNCFIEREHVEDDTIGLHTVMENLNVGDLILNGVETYINGRFNAIIVAVTETLEPAVIRGNYNGVYSTFGYYVFELNDYILVNDLIDDYADAGKSDAIVSIYLCPESVIPPFTSGDLIQRNTRTRDSFTSPKPSTLNGYTPKNNKLFVSPYSTCVLNNSDGQENEYKYEYFSGSNVEFLIKGVIVGNPEQSAYPKNYKGSNQYSAPYYDNLEEPLVLKNYPQCGFDTDIYKNWLAQNVVSNTLGVGSSLVGLGVGIATANPLAIVGGAIGIGHSIGGFIQNSIIPDSANTNATSSTPLGYTEKTFKIFHKCMKEENARIIDNYFDMFGYKVNTLKTPNFTSRTNWNFIKTLEVNIYGNIPNNDLKKIHDIFKAGITYWHNDNVGNYNRPNNPI